MPISMHIHYIKNEVSNAAKIKHSKNDTKFTAIYKEIEFQMLYW